MFKPAFLLKVEKQDGRKSHPATTERIVSLFPVYHIPLYNYIALADFRDVEFQTTECKRNLSDKRSVINMNLKLLLKKWDLFVICHNF